MSPSPGPLAAFIPGPPVPCESEHAGVLELGPSMVHLAAVEDQAVEPGVPGQREHWCRGWSGTHGPAPIRRASRSARPGEIPALRATPGPWPTDDRPWRGRLGLRSRIRATFAPRPVLETAMRRRTGGRSSSSTVPPLEDAPLEPGVVGEGRIASSWRMRASTSCHDEPSKVHVSPSGRSGRDAAEKDDLPRLSS